MSRVGCRERSRGGAFLTHGSHATLTASAPSPVCGSAFAVERSVFSVDKEQVDPLAIRSRVDVAGRAGGGRGRDGER